ncbi:MAG: energy transducer TonB [Sphingobacteriaceae bacterium]|nr:MAG: energy transducer TonB [Sphingobacteriaceae bacterium]
MFQSKFNLYNIEWLDVVFSERNKSYGAYELRKHYNRNLLKALFITATLFSAGLFSASYLLHPHQDLLAAIKPDDETVIELSDIKPPPAAPDKPISKKPVLPAHSAAQKPVLSVSQNMKPVADQLAKIDPKPIDAQNFTPGNVDIPGDLPGLNTLVNGGTASGNGTDKPDNGVRNTGMVEKLPEFPGGMDAWVKFLSKNLRYPEQAASDGVSGRVYMSFIVEKDGKITDIQVSRAAGHGFDEEAKRVLKMAPTWKPGIQNGKPVRVRYTIPINFTIQE